MQTLNDNTFTLAQFSQFLCFMCGAVIMFYYTYLVILLFDKKSDRRLTKRKFLWGLIPFSIWITLVIEEYMNLD